MPIETVLPIVIGISILSLIVAFFLARQVLAADTGTPQMRAISDAIREGAEAFLSRQYRTIGMLSVVAALAIFGFYFVNREVKNIAEMGEGTFWRVTVSFLVGALCSAIAGYIGMFVSIRANIRTATAALTSLNKALQIALRGGAVSGLAVVSMSLLGVGGLFWLFGGMHELRARAAADRRLRLRRQLRGPLRPARRRDLHEGRRRRRRPGRQGRGRHPRGRSAQPGRDRRPRRRQRGRLRRPRRRPLRVDGGRERRRHDPRHRALPGVRAGRDPLPAARARLRPDRHDRRRLHGQDPRGRGPDERPQPGLSRHDRPGHGRLRRGRLPAAHARGGLDRRVASRVPAGSRASSASSPRTPSSGSPSTTPSTSTARCARSRRPARPARPRTSSAASRWAWSAPACR